MDKRCLHRIARALIKNARKEILFGDAEDIIAWINGADAPWPFEETCEMAGRKPSAVKEEIELRYKVRQSAKL